MSRARSNASCSSPACFPLHISISGVESRGVDAVDGRVVVLGEELHVSPEVVGFGDSHLSQ